MTFLSLQGIGGRKPSAAGRVRATEAAAGPFGLLPEWRRVPIEERGRDAGRGQAFEAAQGKT